MPAKTTLSQLLKKNRKVDFQTFNFFNKKAIKKLDFEKKSKTSKAEQLEILKTHQRLLRVTGVEHSAKKLQAKKLHSAIQIASMPEHRFVEEYGGVFKDNLPAGQAGGVSREVAAAKAHKKALAIKSNVVLKHQAILQHNQPHYNAMRVGNLKEATDAKMKHLPSYEELFGTIDFCTCPDCRSIFSPAAYFVDLMRLEDQYIEAPQENSLEQRRADLFTLPLSCENTNASIPKLEIVNEVLERQIIPAPDNNAEGEEGVYDLLDAAVYPFKLPFGLGQTQVRTYLNQSATSLWKLQNQLASEAKTTEAYYLDQAGITSAQWDIISKVADLSSVKTFYGTADLYELRQVPFSLLQTGMTIGDLTQLIEGDLAPDETYLRANFFINQKFDFLEDPIAYKNPTTKEELSHLVNESAREGKTTHFERLDLVNRFVRLANHLNWSFIDLNWLLECLDNQLDSTILPYMGWMQTQLQSNESTSVNQLCGLLFKLKTSGRAQGPSFFDSIFKADHVLPLPEGHDWLDGETFWEVPLGQGVDKPEENAGIQASLESALQIGSDDLQLIGEWMLRFWSRSSRPITLDLESLTVMYRLSQLPVLTGLSIKEFLVSLNWRDKEAAKELVGNQAEDVLDQIIWLQSLSENLTKTPFSVYELEYYLTGSSHDPDIQNQILGINAIDNFIKEVDRTLSIPESDPEVNSEEKDLEDSFQLLLSGLLGTEVIISKQICNWAGLRYDDITVEKLLAAQRYYELIRACGYSAEEVRFLGDNLELFGVKEMAVLSLSQFITLYRFKLLIVRSGDTQNRFIDFLNKEKPDSEDLTKLTSWPADQVNWLTNSDGGMSIDMTSVTGLIDLQNWFTVSQILNINVQALQQLIGLLAAVPEDTDRGYVQAADSLWAGLSGRYAKEPTVLDQLTGQINEAKRNAMVPYVMWRLNGGDKIQAVDLKKEDLFLYKTARDLFNYLLIDVEVSNAVATSRVLEAISTVQLYIYRSRNNLELGTTVADELNTWWDWIGNYRVWEANREVFLYPENYIQPELRNHTTPEFARLINDLQQTDLTDPTNINLAFNGYVEEFNSIAGLTITGATARNFMENGGRKEVCFIGHTIEDPLTWYYRVSTFLETTTSPPFKRQKYLLGDPGIWKKIDLKMTAIGRVNAVFAFSTWYIFWVENYKEEDTSKLDRQIDEPILPLTAGKIMFSYLDLNGNWIPPQTLTEDLEGKDRDFSDDSYRQAMPVFYTTTQSILISYGEGSDGQTFKIEKNSNSIDFDMSIAFLTRVLPALSPKVLGEQEKEGEEKEFTVSSKSKTGFTYTGTMGYYEVPELIGQSSSLWVNYANSSETDLMPLIDGFSINKSNQVVFADEVLDKKNKLKPGQWNHFAYNFFSIDDKFSGIITLPENAIKTSFCVYKEILYACWVQKTTSGSYYSIYMGQFDPESKEPIGESQKLKDISYESSLQGRPVLCEHKNKLFLAWPERDNYGMFIAEIAIEGNELIEPRYIRKYSLQGYRSEKFELISFQNELHLIYPGFTNGQDDKEIKIAVAMSSSATELVGNETLPWQPVANTGDIKYVKDGLSWARAWCVFDLDMTLILAYSSKTDSKLVQGTISKSGDSYSFNKSSSDFGIKYDDNKPMVGISTGVGTMFIIGVPLMEEGSYDPGIEGVLLQKNATTFTLLETNRYDVEGDNYSLFRVNEITSLARGESKNTFIDIDKTSATSVFVNGVQLDSSIPVRPIPTNIAIGESEGTYLKGCFAEFIWLKELLTEKKAKNIFDNGLSTMPVGLDWYVTKFEDLYLKPEVDCLTVFGQPNWFIASYERMIYLNVPGFQDSITQSSKLEFDVFRVNSNASRDLKYEVYGREFDDLLRVENQKLEEPSFDLLKPVRNRIAKAPEDQMDIVEGFSSSYYWDLFFHAPFLVAQELSRHQLYESAKAWFEYIFNPTINQENEGAYPNDKYWRFLGLRSANNETLRDELDRGTAAEIEYNLGEETGVAQLYAYHNDPFDPHAIANLRPIAYQKTMVMHYVQNLIDWGDRLFAQYTQESIREATMLYVLAYDLLGNQPDNMGPCPLPPVETLKNLIDFTGEKRVRDINEFLVKDIENDLGPVPILNASDGPANYIENVYFGIPDNERFRNYWDTIAQRLYNIRHALNINGVMQSLSLFEPKLDPMAIAGAVANGESIAGISGVVTAWVPYYRFEVMVQKARELCQQVMTLGQSLLSAFEKKDAEVLSLLLSTNEQNLQQLNLESREYAIEEAQRTTESLEINLANAVMRKAHYERLISKGRLAAEETQLNTLVAAVTSQTVAASIHLLSTASFLLPNTFGLANGGMQYGKAVESGARAADVTASMLHSSSSIAGLNAEFQRRNEDWKLQEQMAAYEIDQLREQIEAATLRQQMAVRELSILQKSIDQTRKVEDHYKNKFTNAALYQWMSGKISSLFFQTYQLTQEAALQAQEAWNFEKATDQKFIQAGYWDNLHQGLLAGEGLMLDIQRMEAAYMRDNKRRLEITKTISLAQEFPDKLKELTDWGTCTFDLSSDMFDEDYPGHHTRQIKSVALSFPVLLGPYQNIHATLTQTSGETITAPDIEAVKYQKSGGPRPKKGSIRSHVMRNQSIALSQGMNDSGLFVLNFGDDRFLPFEGNGAISSWQLDIPDKSNPGLLKTLTDVVMELKYTALAGSDEFKKEVEHLLEDYEGVSIKVISSADSEPLRQFLSGDVEEFSLPLNQFQVRKGLTDCTVQAVSLIVKPTDKGRAAFKSCTLSLNASHKLKFKHIDKDIVARVQIPEVLVTDEEMLTLSRKQSASFFHPDHIRELVWAIEYAAKR